MEIIKKIRRKYKSIPVSARAAMWFVFCSFVQKCISFITVPIFTRMMPTAEYGLYSTYLSWYSVVVVICTLNMQNCVYINRVTKAEKDEEKARISVELLSLAGTITFIVYIIYLILHKWINLAIGMPTALVSLLFAQVLFEPPVSYWTVQKRFDFKYKPLVFRTIAMVLCNAMLGIAFVFLSDKNQAIARAFSIAIVQAVFGGAFYIYFIKKAKIIFSTKGWRHALEIQLPLLPHGLSLTILSSADRIMINSIVGATETALYSVAYSAGYIVNILKNSMTDALTPWIYSRIREHDYMSIREKTKPIMVLVACITFIFVAFAPEIIMIMAPKQYLDAIYVIPPVAASSFFTFLYNTFSSISFYFEKTKKIMVASMSGAVLNIILNLICIPTFGYIAAGYTTLVCYVFFTIAHYFIMRKVCEEELEGVKIFDMKYMVGMSAIVIVFTIIFSLVYNNILVRYGIIVILISIVFMKRKWLIDSVKAMKKGRKRNA